VSVCSGGRCGVPGRPAGSAGGKTSLDEDFPTIAIDPHVRPAFGALLARLEGGTPRWEIDMDDSWSPFDLTPSGMGVVIVIALIIAMVVAQWSKHRNARVETSAAHVETSGAGSAAPATPPRAAPVAAARSSTPDVVALAIAECRRHAANRSGYRLTRAPDGSEEDVKNDDRYRRVYARCMRARGYAG
jgi:Na+-transporting methylmalonyl-CoA/oxaloacetate decarboxylase gamma subunit